MGLQYLLFFIAGNCWHAGSWRNQSAACSHSRRNYCVSKRRQDQLIFVGKN